VNFNQFPMVNNQYWQIPTLVTGLQSTVNIQCKKILEMEGRIGQLEAMVFSNFYVTQHNLIQCQQPSMPEQQTHNPEKYVPWNYQPAADNANQEATKRPKKKKKGGWAESNRLSDNKPATWEQGRGRAVALDLRASVCKLLWVHYDELPHCNRVPENLKEIYRKNWDSFNEMEMERVIEAQVRFLRVIRQQIWLEKRDEIAALLIKEGILPSGEVVTEAHVTKYLKEQGWREKSQRSKKRSGQNGIGLIEIWRDYGRPLSDQVGEPLRSRAPKDIHQVSPSRPKKTLWDRLQFQRAKLALIFQCPEEDLVNIHKIPVSIRNFYTWHPDVQRQRPQKELQGIMEEQTRVLKAHQDVLTIMNQRETIKRLMRLEDLSSSNQTFPPKLRELYRDRTLVFLLPHERRKEIKVLQQEFISKYRSEVIAPVKRALTELLRQRNYQLALENEVLNTSQIRYYFRSLDFARWKLIREDSLQEIQSDLEAYLESVDNSKETDGEKANVHFQSTPVVQSNTVKADLSVDTECADLVEAIKTPLVIKVDEQKQHEVESMEVEPPTQKLGTPVSSKEEICRKKSGSSQASGRSKMGWASEMSYYDEHSASSLGKCPLPTIKTGSRTAGTPEQKEKVEVELPDLDETKESDEVVVLQRGINTDDPPSTQKPFSVLASV